MSDRPARPSVLLDCDPGHDDAIALAVAAAHCDLVGVTTVGGNVRLELTTRNALAVLQLLGVDAPVHSGAALPRAGTAVEDARHVHGESGLEGATLPEVTRAVAGTDAAGFIVEAAHSVENLWLVVTGPMTNVAAALDRDPDLGRRLAGISIMGGGTAGNVTAVAEFNVHHDPEAAAVVLACGAPVIVMCGLDLTHQMRVTDELITRVRATGTAFGAFAADALTGYLRNICSLTGDDGHAALHDPCVVLALTHRDLFTRRSVTWASRRAAS